MSAASAGRHHSLHWLLRHQRHVVHSKTNALVQGLQNVDVRNQSPKLDDELSHVARALKSMRSHALQHHQGSRGAKSVVKGLKQLEDAYNALAKAQTISDPAARFALIADAVNQLKSAKRSAHRAGADWPL